MADNVIETRELTKKFGGFTAVDHLNLGAKAGAKVAPSFISIEDDRI